MIKVSESKLHWNYFLALERNAETISRYIEFTSGNFRTYSIELARVLLAAASEVDVVAKALCKILAPSRRADRITDYRSIIVIHLPHLARERVYVSRYGLTLDPWSSWRKKKTPDNPLWWKAYNQVKHQRSSHFDQASLQHTLNSMAGLLLMNYYYYMEIMRPQWPSNKDALREKDVTAALEPESTLFRLNEEYYFSRLVV